MVRLPDGIDRRILDELSRNGRLTNQALAARIGMSAPACLRRVRRLEEDGYIRGYRADLSAERLGFRAGAYLLVTLSSQTKTAIEEFEKHIAAFASVRECYALNGEADFILKYLAPEQDALSDFVDDLMRTNGVRNVRVLPVASRAKGLAKRRAGTSVGLRRFD